MTVTVFTKPDCPQCTVTKGHLAKLGIEFIELPIDEDVLTRAVGSGVTSAPVVEVDRQDGNFPEIWGGYRPDRIKALVA